VSRGPVKDARRVPPYNLLTTSAQASGRMIEVDEHEDPRRLFLRSSMVVGPMILQNYRACGVQLFYMC